MPTSWGIKSVPRKSAGGKEGSVFTRWSINAVSPSPHKIIEHGSIETIELNMTHHDSV